jgi:S1-C subfamily serine protease
MNENSNNQDMYNQAQPGFVTGSRVTSPLPEAQQPWIAPQAPSRKQRKQRAGFLPGLMLVGMLVLGMLFGGAGAGAAVMLLGHSSAPATVTVPATTSSGQPVAQVQANTITNIYNKVSPSVVMINSTIQGTRTTSGGEATGSGIVLDTQGDILTNYHVIDGASSVKIELTDHSDYAATVVGTAPQDDLAVIKSTSAASKMTPAELGDSSTVQVGDEVIAIGYPFGLDQSVSSGIVSGLNRTEAGESGRSLSGLIQTDAAINPGNSGGPLLNDQGQVIGIDTMIESPVEGFTGIGLAIPINNAKSLLSQLEQGSTVQRPWIGISGIDITADVQQQFNLPVSKGVLVMGVTSGSPAAAAGLQASTASADGSTISQLGDIITAVDGNAVSSVTDLTNYLNSKAPGDKVTLSITRNGQSQDVSVTLQAWPANLSSSSDNGGQTNPNGGSGGNGQTNPNGGNGQTNPYGGNGRGRQRGNGQTTP